MAGQNQGAQAPQKGPEKGLTEAEVAARVKAAEDKVRAEYEAKLEAASEPTEADATADGDERGSYELLLPVYHEVLSEPGKPLKVREYKRGDPIRLTEERAAEFIADKVVKDPNRAATTKPGAQTRAPGERR